MAGIDYCDVLIVGAGSAGSVLAERLSANSACRVIVIEAGVGGDDVGVRALVENGMQLPIGDASPVVRRYRSMLTETPARPFGIVRGATVGGSGAINGGYFCHARPADFESYRVPGWAWSDVAPYYRAVETDLDFPGSPHLPTGGGPIHIRRVPELRDISAAFVEASQAAGYHWLPDLNDAGALDGVGAVPLNIVDGIRQGPGTAFLQPALGRPNLTVLTQTRAITLELAGARIRGVLAATPAGPVTLRAPRVVVAAGAIETARLLMQSGIGPAEVLQAATIRTVVDLPVGQRCWDHPEWVMATSWNVAARRPVIEVVLARGSIEIRPYTGGFISMIGDSGDGRPDWPHIGVALMRPKARGRITVVSADPSAAPVIEHRYDSEPSDIAELEDGAELAREIVGELTALGPPKWSTSQHLGGTAPMGLDSDDYAVVDPRCRVHGVSGLWVMDGSILPGPTSRGPHATIAMLACRAAEFVGC